MKTTRCDRTPAWSVLQQQFEQTGRSFDLRTAFAADSQRFRTFSLPAPHVFADLSRKHGKAHLATKHRHAKASYALVSFGKDDKNLRAYKADELRLTCVDESK